LLTTACLPGGRELTGIWHAELEMVPGLRSALDIQLSQDITGKWSGRFELPELMAASELQAVNVQGSKIELHLGAGTVFKGELSKDKTAIGGVLDAPGQKAENVNFKKVPHWSAQIPARADKNGQPVRSWKYQPPLATGDGWQVGLLPESVADSKLLNELFEQILQGKFHGLDAFLVAQHGELILEEYFYLGGRERLHSIQSATKSVTSLLFGTARDQGLIKNLDEPLKSYFPQYADSAQASTSSPTLRHALTMSAALDWKEDIPYSNPENDAVRMNQSSDLYKYVLSKSPDPVDKPGDRFEYNSGLSILLGGVLLHTTGKPADNYARETLFKTLKINHFAWTSMGGKVHTGGGLFLRPRDLLKIGQMVLDSGKWNGRQVVSENWIRESTAFILPISEGYKDFGYGYQWWRGTVRTDTGTFPVIYASGYGGQMLYIVPDLDLVVLTFHHNPADNDGSHSITWKTVERVVIPAFR
jgi:CubicO group peptidase (beta-lactamase class C family)